VPGPIAVDEGRPSSTLLRERQKVLLTGRASTIATNNGGQNPRFQIPSVFVNLKPLFQKKIASRFEETPGKQEFSPLRTIIQTTCKSNKSTID